MIGRQTGAGAARGGGRGARRWLARVAAALAGLLVLLLGYGILIEPRLLLDERRYVVALPDLDEQLSGLEVAVFSDLQVGMWWANVGMVRRIVERVVEAEPDAVVIAGDFLYSADPELSVQVDTVLELLAPLRDAGLPTFAVLGNHDFAVGGVEELTAALEGTGIEVLRDDAVPLTPATGAQPLYLVGLAARASGRADPQSAVSEVPAEAPRFVVMHNPTTFPALLAHQAPIAVAGHTHCGQVALPGAPRWSYIGLTEEERVVADGFAPPDYGANGNRLFVTCGIGFSVVPIRINARPQVVFFELVPAP